MEPLEEEIPLFFLTGSRFQEPHAGVCVSFVFSTWSSMASSTSSRWWFQRFFYFHPYLGKWSNLTNIFQRGWNHQLVNFFDLWLCRCHSSTRNPLSIMHPTLRVQESKDLQEHPWENPTILKISSFLLNNISTIRSWKEPTLLLVPLNCLVEFFKAPPCLVCNPICQSLRFGSFAAKSTGSETPWSLVGVSGSFFFFLGGVGKPLAETKNP